MIQGNCLDVLKTLKEKSIDTIITSPPYFQQRDYEVEKQIGSEKNVSEYIDTMRIWGQECLRVLKDTGSLFLNIGDKYEKKGLQMIPERVCIALCDSGWVLRNKIVWHKPNHMPSSVKDRFCSSWEPVYFFTKDSGKYYSQEYYCDLDSLREQTKTSDKHDFPKTLDLNEYDKWLPKIEEWNKTHKKNSKFKGGINNGASPGARNIVSYSKMRKEITEEQELQVHTYLKEKCKNLKWTAKKLDEHFGYKSKAGHWLRLDHGRSLPSPEDFRKLKDLLGLEGYDFMMSEHYVLQSVQNNPKGKTPEDVWSINLTHEKGLEHFAMFPVELPLRILRAFCPPDGIVLDPFAGSGTTGLAAKQLGIQYLLIELNPEFVRLANKRLGNNLDQ
jgi:DNA modification methylase